MKNVIDMQTKMNCVKYSIIDYTYRHFKGGIYFVTDMAINTDTGEIMVIYHDCDDSALTWCRPLDEFMSEVDHEKYPDVKQKMKFEKM